MFTSLYPLQHGVQRNSQRLDESFVTLAERLNQSGYDTAAFVSTDGLFGRSRVAQGFKDYDQPGKDLGYYPDGKRRKYRPADQTTDVVLQWLASRPVDQPFFLWVHYYDPHKHLGPPAVHLEQVAPRTESERDRLAEFLVREHHSNFKRANWLDQIIKYDAEIRFVDTHIERLFNGVQGHAPEASTLWIVTSDHGQGLENHDFFGHQYHIYNEQLHVPLFFHFSDGRIASHVVADQLVEHVDVPVTILDLVGETLDSQIAAVQGQSLAPLLFADTGYEHKSFAFSESATTTKRSEGSNSKRKRRRAKKYALQSLRAKYLWVSEGPDEYYDLAADPYETLNLIDQPDSVRDELRDALQHIVSALRSDEEATIVDEETLERLRSLGYLR